MAHLAGPISSPTGHMAHPAGSPSLSTDPARLLVADSFRVHEHHGVAQVRGFTHHLARFRDEVRAVVERVSNDPDVVLSALEAFLERSRERIAAAGEGFPRLECRADAAGEVFFRLTQRPLPELGTTLALKTAPYAPVREAGVKGPNIAHFAELRAALGAEPLLTDRRGHVTEGGTTSLVWWDANNTSTNSGAGGFVVPTVTPANRVPSVTEYLVSEIARARGLELTPAQVTPAELQGREVWAVNALHGIRPVVELDGSPMPRGDIERLDEFKNALEETWEPVSPGAAVTQ